MGQVCDLAARFDQLLKSQASFTRSHATHTGIASKQQHPQTLCNSLASPGLSPWQNKAWTANLNHSTTKCAIARSQLFATAFTDIAVTDPIEGG